MDRLTHTHDDDVYEIPANVLDDVFAIWQPDASAVWQPGVSTIWQTNAAQRPAEGTPATYLLAEDVCCPQCFEPIRSVHVYGVTGKRSPGDGAAQGQKLVVACPKCASTVPAELAGL